jgi:uncharacterized protein with NRDE domain
VRSALEASTPTEATLRQISQESARYAGFNLLLCDGIQLGVHESRSGAVRILEPGIHGLSNHLLGSPWPKLERARAAMADALHALPADDALLRLLRDTTTVEDHRLPRTGVSLEWERWLAPAFIRAPGYGTRCSSVLTIDREGEVRLTEWTWTERGDADRAVTHRYRIDASPDARFPLR